MQLDIEIVHGWIVDELARKRTVGESITSLVDRCEAACPHPDWSRLRALPFADLSPLLDWIQRPFQDEPPPASLRGLWFGLFNPCPDGRNAVTDLYVCGSEEFEPLSTDADWAVDPEWWPQARYASSSVLAAIHRIANGQGLPVAERQDLLGGDAEYPLCLGYAAFAVRELLTRVAPSLILGESDSLGIVVGFDSGDFIQVGQLSALGLVAIDSNSHMNEWAIESVREALRSSNARTVFRSIHRLERFGGRAREAVPELVQIIGSTDDAAPSGAALIVLASIAPNDPRTRAAVFDALDHCNPSMRLIALNVFGNLKGLSASDLARIKSMNNDPDKNVARQSRIALRDIIGRRDAPQS